MFRAYRIEKLVLNDLIIMHGRHLNPYIFLPFATVACFYFPRIPSELSQQKTTSMNIL